MKPRTLAIALAVAGVLAVGLYVAVCGDDDGARPRYGSLAEVRANEHALDPDAHVAALASLDSDDGYRELAALYTRWAARSGTETQRRLILQALIDSGRPALALELIVQALTADSRTFADDPLARWAAEKMIPLYSDPTALDKARDWLVGREDAKTKQVLARSLMNYAESDHSRALAEQPRRKLAADLIDTFYSLEQGDDLRTEITRRIGAVAGDEVAISLMTTEPGNELTQREQDELIDELVASASRADIDLAQFKSAVDMLAKKDRDALVELSRHAKITESNPEARRYLLDAIGR